MTVRTGSSGSGQACGHAADHDPGQAPCWPPEPMSGPAVVGVGAVPMMAAAATMMAAVVGGVVAAAAVAVVAVAAV